MNFGNNGLHYQSREKRAQLIFPVRSLNSLVMMYGFISPKSAGVDQRDRATTVPAAISNVSLSVVRNESVPNDPLRDFWGAELERFSCPPFEAALNAIPKFDIC